MNFINPLTGRRYQGDDEPTYQLIIVNGVECAAEAGTVPMPQPVLVRINDFLDDSVDEVIDDWQSDRPPPGRDWHRLDDEGPWWYRLRTWPLQRYDPSNPPVLPDNVTPFPGGPQP